MNKTKLINRRNFLKRAGLATCTGLAFPHVVPSSVFGKGGVVPPSERITLGAIGIGAQGRSDLKGFLQLPDVQVVAVCDVKRPARELAQRWVNERYEGSVCDAYHDFHELLAREDIDAVSIVTPVHWHSIMALAATRAGKDIFMEKPVALSLQEGKLLRAAIKRYDRMFQIGTQQRSGRNFRFACELALNERIGRVHTIKVGTSYGLVSENFPAMPVPEWLDYDRWVGPAPWAPYTEKRMSRGIHENISDYSLGMIHCWGIHHLDIAQWGNGTDNTGPIEVQGTGTFPRDGLCDCLLGWDVSMLFANGVRIHFTDGKKNEHGIRFEGDKGWVFVNRQTLEAEPKSILKERIGPNEKHLPVSNNHFQNFLDCVKTRQSPVAPIDVAVRSDTLCQLSYIAVQLGGRKLKWDADSEQFVGDDEANRFLLPRPMRSPWHL